MLVRRLCILCAALALVAMPATATAASGTADKPKPEVLWNAYPIDPSTGTTAAATATGAQTSASPEPRPAATHPIDSSKRSSALRIAIIAVAAVVGIVVGLIPALMLGIVLGVVPRPRRVRPRRRAHPAHPAPARPAATEPVPDPVPDPVLEPVPPVGALITFHEPPPEPEPTPLHALVPDDLPEPDEADDDEDLAAGDERHRDLYDAAYADQLYRIESLRRTIRAGLAIHTVSTRAQQVPPPGDDHD
jgi:hypothetical protein